MVLDLQMPQVPGGDFIGIVRSYVRFADVPIVVFSAFPQPAWDPWPNAVAYVRKPADPEMLFAAARQLGVGHGGRWADRSR